MRSEITPLAKQRVVHDTDLGIEDPTPDEGDHDRRDDVREQQQAAEDRDARQCLMKEQGDGHSEQRLKHNRKARPNGRLPKGSPEQLVVEDVREVGQADEGGQVGS